MSDTNSSFDNTKDKLASSLGDVKANANSTASEVKANASSTASDVKANVSSTMTDLSAKSSATLEDAKQSVKGNPIGLLIGGVVVGAVIAAFAPVTEMERRRVQPVRDDLVGRATKAKDDVVRAGRGVLEETVSAASHAVNKHSNELAKELEDDFKTTDVKPAEEKSTNDRAADSAQSTVNRTADKASNAVDKTATKLKG